jgi:phosphopantetheinyl transferase
VSRAEQPAGVLWRTEEVTGANAVSGHAHLSAGERARAATISHPGARQRFVVGRSLLRRTIAEHSPDLGDTELAIAVAASGRPHLGDGHDLEISLAHTHGLAVAAVADATPLGIDVEPLDRAAPAVSTAWLTTAELERLGSADEADPRGLLRRWLAKEAALKACDQLGPSGLAAIEIHGADPHDPAPQDTDRAPTPPMDPPADAIEVGRGHAVVPVDHLPDGVPPVAGGGAVVVPVAWFEVAAGYVVAVAARAAGHARVTDTGQAGERARAARPGPR